MRKLVLFMHVSLDGFVAGPNGEMNWINTDEAMFEYAGKQTDESDTALYGRVTYEMMNSYWPTAGDQPVASKHDKQHSAWYNKVSKVVVSKTMNEKDFPGLHIINNNPAEEISMLKKTEGKNILIFGSPGTSHSLMTANLIDEYWLFINPVLLGEGIPLFKNIKTITKLKLFITIPFPSGVVCLNYTK